MLLTGEVSIFIVRRGKTIPLVRKARNHFVNAGLKGISSAMLGNYIRNAGLNYVFRAWSYDFRIRVGTNTTTPTTPQMSALQGDVGADPNVHSGENLSNPSAGVWEALWRANWNVMTLNMTVGECGLYLRPFTEWSGLWYREYTASATTLALALISRLSAADGDFEVFEVTQDDALQIDWTLRMSYE